MTTVNKRTSVVQAGTINGVSAGGMTRVDYEQGYDTILYSDPDGLQIPMKDRIAEFCRGTITTQDWAQIIDILNGTLGTFVCWERISGVAEASGFIKHTITNPVIHRAAFSFTKGQYGVVVAEFECRAADETKGFLDMHGLLDAQTAPTYVSAARGRYRIVTAVHSVGSISVYHLMDFQFALNLSLLKASNDADVGYTCVDAMVDGLRAEGSMTFQDSTIKASTLELKGQLLLAAARGNLVLTVTQGGGAAAKTATIAGVTYDTARRSAANAGGRPQFTTEQVTFSVGNDPTTQLTLAGANKILTIV